MASSTTIRILSLFCLMVLLNFPLSNGSLVPALFIFGDSIVDAGNNNELQTIIRADFLPYGRDINNNNNINSNTPTGRFSNGRLAVDFVAETLQFSSYPPPYLSKQARGRNLLNGANFASAASGYFDYTADMFHAIRLGNQLDNYREYQVRLEELIGVQNASEAFRNGIHLLSTGTSDFLQNYYINPLLQTTFTVDQFSNLLVQNYTRFVQELYDMGARKIGVTTLPPMGCVPAAITLFGTGNNMCVDRLNYDALSFNRKLNATSINLQTRLSGLRLILLDIYHPLYNIIQNPADNGFSEVRRGCCGTGLLETSILCNSLAIGTCTNASQYVFWDAFHPSEAANALIANYLEGEAYDLISPTPN